MHRKRSPSEIPMELIPLDFTFFTFAAAAAAAAAERFLLTGRLAALIINPSPGILRRATFRSVSSLLAVSPFHFARRFRPSHPSRDRHL